jgi:hypothetical protein
VRCKTCHYSLANLTEHRCPECGCAFDPNDPSTFITEGSTMRADWLTLLAILACVLLVASIITIVLIAIAWDRVMSQY